jgi:hypothetical protein
MRKIDAKFHLKVKKRLILGYVGKFMHRRGAAKAGRRKQLKSKHFVRFSASLEVSSSNSRQ